ncbi:MAG: nitroreductase family deazaflavin-dependent oxidoreductase [Caldilineaceae bacterium]|nr:nitroreductase family deazaflavin-dependent oxidoreductase [Caldilineaceae bacterium]
MDYQPPSLFHRTIRRLITTGPLLSLLPRFQHRLDKAVLRWSGGRTTLAALLVGAPVLMLTSVGARSGKPRTTPLLAILRGDRPGEFAVIASNWGQARNPAWYYNLKAHPRAAVRAGDEEGAYVAREVFGEEYDAWWAAALETYAGYAVYRTRAGDRRIPVIVMQPDHT